MDKGVFQTLELYQKEDYLNNVIFFLYKHFILSKALKIKYVYLSVLDKNIIFLSANTDPNIFITRSIGYCKIRFKYACSSLRS